MKPVLKYPGSKWRIAGEIVARIPEHHTYLEPFFGSGAVFFSKEPSRIAFSKENHSDAEWRNF